MREDILLDKVRHILHVPCIGHQGWQLTSEYLSIFVVLQMIEAREIWTVPPVVVVLVCGPRSCFQTETVQSDTVTIPRGIYRQGRSDLEND